MPDVASVLKEEIARIARREIKASVDPLKKQVGNLRQGMRALKQQNDRMEKMISGLVKEASKRKVIPEPSDDGETRKTRLTPASIKKHRQRLKLSQVQMGQLLRVSGQSVIRWEQGTSQPRGANRDALVELRGMGIREVKERLEG